MAANLLATDGYKFSMAEAGWPLRRETFYLSHRKGGLQVLPFDVEVEVKRALPEVADGDWAFLARNQYEMGPAFRSVLEKPELTVRALPRLSVFAEREPVMTVTGPSALVSWLEPLALQFNYRIQVATLAVFEPEKLPAAVAELTCEAQRALVLETLDAVKVTPPPMRVDSEGYVERVRARVAELVEIVGTADRLFEVGLRAATCVEQHLLALEGCRRAGLTRTSHVLGASVLGLTPVGTMGHEHIQRFGSDDAAFRAMVERRYQRSSFLLDTFDTMTSGLPAALALMSERGQVGDSIRYDSGDKEAQYRRAFELSKQHGVRPVQILEDGFDAAQTRRFEALRVELGLRPDEQVYGYGGYLVAQTAGTPLTRDRVSAVYKLSQTGQRPTMKFGNDSTDTSSLSGKQSVPGVPVVFRRRAGTAGPYGVIGQAGEAAPEGYVELTGAAPLAAPSREVVRPEDAKAVLSEGSKALVAQLKNWRPG